MLIRIRAKTVERELWKCDWIFKDRGSIYKRRVVNQCREQVGVSMKIRLK